MQGDRRWFFHRSAQATLRGLLVATMLMVGGDAFGQGGSSRTATLEQRLTFGLQARRPQEIAFVQAVIDTVNRGKLPLRLVDRTFFWARRRAPSKGGKFLRRPIIYFQPALEIQAKRLGIVIKKDAPSPSS